MLRYRLPDGRSWKRLWVGGNISRMEGRGAPMISAAVFTDLLFSVGGESVGAVVSSKG